LQGQAAEAGETFGVRGAKFRNFLILNLDDLAREFHIRPIPEGIDRDGLHIDSHFVQIRETLRNIIVDVGWIVRICQLHITRATLAPDAVFDKVPGFGNTYVRMNINDLHTTAADHNLSPFTGSGSLCGRLLEARRKTQQ